VVEATLRSLARVIVVDDGSTDGAVAALASLPAEQVVLPENRGKGHALLAGFQAALADPATEALCCLDADGQHDPAEIPLLVGSFRMERADLVIGSRVFEGAQVPWRSRFGNRTTVFVTRCLLGRRLPDTQSGFRVLSRRYAEAVLREVPGGRYETEMEMVVKAVREGYRVVSIPIATRYETGNPTSHFRKVGDSCRIYARLFRAAMRRGSRT
jgi:glycosyltransferase involved in cell wall biosynthesis